MIEVMGVVNVTPDSFSDGGEHADPDDAVAHGLALRDAGATILDVGGESTRPGAQPVGSEEERRRVLPVVERLAAAGAVVSIDTYRADVAADAVRAGASIVNDVSGGLADDGMLAAVAATEATLVIGHWRGPSADMYARASYDDIVAETTDELAARTAAAGEAGIPAGRLVLDPGIGFAKAGERNWELLRGLERIVRIGPPVLVGTSRKRFLAGAIGDDASRDRRDLATAVTSVLAQQAGAWGVRVHDVAATRDALAVLDAWEGAR